MKTQGSSSLRAGRFAGLSFFLALAGCSASSVLSPYPGQAAQYRAALNAGTPPAAIARIERKTQSADATLYLLELGRVQQLAGDNNASLKAFGQVLDRFRQQDDRARISASAYAASGASLLTNDNAIPYHGRTYERVFVHQYQALNYLANGDMQGALVEVRRANQVQVDTLARNANKVDKAREDAEAKGFEENRYDNYFSPMDEAAGRVKYSFQNAATLYLSGLIYEAAGQANDAFIDYRKALELVPNNPYLQRDVVRTGQQAGLEVDKLAASLGSKRVGPSANEGDLVIYLEEGYVPSKQPIGIPIWSTRTLNTISFPIYNDYIPPSRQVVYVDGAALETALLVDTRALAVRALKDEVPALLARAFLRLLTKQEMQRQAQQHDSSGLLNLFTTLYSLATDQADLRSWLTLPGSGQLLRVALGEGEHQISVAGSPPLTVSVRKGRSTLVHLVTLPNKTYSRAYPL